MMDAASLEPPASPPATPRKRRTKLTKIEQHQAQILKGLEAGKSQRQVAAELGISHSSISTWLDTVEQSRRELSRFRSSRADVLASLQARSISFQHQLIADLEEDRLRNALTPSQKAGLLHTLTVVSGTAYDKERIETGQSTQNISVVSRMIDSAVQDIYKPMINKDSTGTAPQEGAVGSEQEQESGATPADSDDGGPGGTGGNPDGDNGIAS